MDIRLVVNGQDLDLSPGFTVEREEESSIFNRELNRKDFTYPANIPLTEKNDMILGFISNLAVGEKKREYLADLYFNDVYDNQVTIRVLNVSTISQTVEISIIGTYGTFARIIGDKKLASLQLDGDRTIGTTWGLDIPLGTIHYEYESDDPEFPPAPGFLEIATYYRPSNASAHMKDVMLGTVNADYCFYPSYDNKANIEALNDDGSNLINFYDWQTEAFADPIIEYYRAEMMSKFPQRLFWVPFFKTMYVLRKCFEENGFTISGTVLTDVNFQKSTLYNTATFCSYSVTTEYDSNFTGGEWHDYQTAYISNNSNVIHPQDHMPDITILEFINELAKAWNWQYRINLKLRTVDIIQLKTFKITAPVIDFSSKAFPVHEISFEDNDITDGYKFAFSVDPAESYLSSKQKEDLGDYTVVASVDKLADLTGSYTADNLAYVRRDNAYYQYGGTNWFFYAYNSLGVQTIADSKNPVEINTKAVPLVNSDIELFRTEFDGDGKVVGVSKTLFLPCSTIGIQGKNLVTMKYPHGDFYISSIPVIKVTDSPKLSIQPILVNNHGMRPNADLANYPFGCSFTRDALANLLPGVNHFWDNPDHTGLYYNQWKGWTDNLINSIPVKYDVLFTGIAEDMIDYESNILFIHGQQYVVKKTNKPLPFPCVANFEIIRI